MSRPLALDLFCGAGGASMGLHRAGFDVIGVDHRPQPRYPFTFVRADALRPPFDLAAFDFIWSSPPCQHGSVASATRRAEGRTYPALIEPTRAMLDAAGVPYAIENVPGTKVRPDLVLTGPMFGIKTNRRRHFELRGFYTLGPCKPPVLGPKTAPGFFTAAGNGADGPNRPRLWAEGMGVEWMRSRYEIAQAIPPAYAEYIGRAALAQLTERAA
jgi:DNA (cytosine-5)-methyltransferase 1